MVLTRFSRPTTLVSAIVVFAMAVAATVAGQQPRDVPSTRIGTAEISGRITGPTGDPIVDVSVGARSGSGAIVGRSVQTDAHGNYKLEGLPPGHYTVLAVKVGFLPISYGQISPSDAPRRIVLKDGERATSINWELRRGGVIAGAIVDRNGAPATGIPVTAYRRAAFNGQLRLVPGGPAVLTDDRGEFRLHGLHPDSYYVHAAPRVATTNTVKDPEVIRSGHVPTYYPGTIDVASAQRVRVESEATVNVSMQLEWEQIFTVRGYAPEFAATSSDNTMLTVRPLDGLTAVAARAVTINRRGEFVIGGLTRGRYLLQTLAPRGYAPATRLMAASVEVSGANVAGVSLSPLEMIEVGGQVLFEGAQEHDRHVGVRVSAIPVSLSAPAAHQGAGAAGPDLRFTFKTWPGLSMVNVTVGDPSWHVKAIRLGARDVTDTGVDFAVERNTGLIVQLTSRAPKVSGTILDANGKLVEAASVVFFAKNPELWAVRSGRHVRVARPDQTGQYRLHGLPVGQYYILALDRVIPSDMSDPEVLGALASRALTINLGEGDTRVLDLKVQSEAR